MDLNTLRVSGIAVSGALIAGAIYVAATAPSVPERTAVVAPAPVSTGLTPAAAPQVFALSFRGDGPLARAQRLAMRGGHTRVARRQVERALARQRAFSGLCFDHFSPRGDVVIRTCVPGTATDWVTRLRTVPAVTNVDAAPQLTQDGRGD
jgi:hypothetical protein